MNQAKPTATPAPRTTSSPVSQPAAATKITPPAARTVLPEIKYQYYQSSTALNLSVLAKNLSSEDVSVDFETNHLKVVVRVDGVQGLSPTLCLSHPPPPFQ
jgi:hypothetical protein